MCSTDAPSGILHDDGARRAGPTGRRRARDRRRTARRRARRSSTSPPITHAGAAGRVLTPRRGGPGKSAAAPPPPGRRRSSNGGAGCRRHPSRYRRRQALVLGQDRDAASAAQSGDERFGLDRLRTPLATERERQADDDHLGRLALDDRTQLGHAALAADLLDDAERPRERAARVADRDARARAAVVEREGLGARVTHAESRQRAASSASSRRLASLPPARAIDGRPPPPPPTIGPICLDHGSRVEAVLDRLGRHARDQLHALAVAHAEHDRRRPERAAQAVGELEQRVAERARGRLGHEHLEPSALGRARGQRRQVGPAAVARRHRRRAPPSRARARARSASRRPRAAARAACAARRPPPSRRGRRGAGRPAPRRPVIASIRRTPWPTDDSRTIVNGPTAAVERTCVPPHSSIE